MNRTTAAQSAFPATPSTIGFTKRPFQHFSYPAFKAFKITHAPGTTGCSSVAHGRNSHRP